MTRTVVSIAAAASLFALAACEEAADRDAPRARAAERTVVKERVVREQPVIVEDKEPDVVVEDKEPDVVVDEDPTFEGRIRLPDIEVDVKGDARR